MKFDTLAQLAWLPAPPINLSAKLHDAITGESVSLWQKLLSWNLSERALTRVGKAFEKWRAGKNNVALEEVRLLLLSNNTTNHLHHPIIASGLRYGLDVRILAVSYLEADTFAEIRRNDLRSFNPSAILLAFDHRGYSIRECLGSEIDEDTVVEDCIRQWTIRVASLKAASSATLISQTIAAPPTTTLGHIDAYVFGTNLRVITRLNNALVESAQSGHHVLLDIATLASSVGTSNWFDERLYNLGLFPFSLTFLPLYADHIGRKLAAIHGKSRRVLVLDLDNTLWGGVVGDDGVNEIELGGSSQVGKAFIVLQRKALQLRSRGVLLAIASKNDESVAKRPFRERDEMLLKENSFAAFQANWDDKATNLRRISEELSLGLDSFVFMDDNPAERELVRYLLPEVAVPELPDDPTEYASILDAAGYFEAASFLEEDGRRSDLYERRATLKRIMPDDIGSFFAGLNMRLVVEVSHEGNRARIVQLINKSNQFNLTTARIKEPELLELEMDENACVLGFRLSDRLDDHGLISVVSLIRRGLDVHITRWLMSCRVIGRRVEEAVLGVVAEQAKELGGKCLIGEYRPTSRNEMVAEHYCKLGFTCLGTTIENAISWRLDLEEFTLGQVPIETHWQPPRVDELPITPYESYEGNPR